MLRPTFGAGGVRFENEFEYRYNNRKQENDITFRNLIERVC